MTALARKLPDWMDRTVRLALGLIGGYFVTNSYIGFTGVALSELGLARGEAASFAILTSAFVFVGLIVWSAATRRLFRTAIVVIASSIIMAICTPYLTAL
ncbi:MAG: hypothetical protein AAGK23_02750 [Pseudomonadota bacterium]